MIDPKQSGETSNLTSNPERKRYLFNGIPNERELHYDPTVRLAVLYRFIKSNPVCGVKNDTKTIVNRTTRTRYNGAVFLHAYPYQCALYRVPFRCLSFAIIRIGVWNSARTADSDRRHFSAARLIALFDSS